MPDPHATRSIVLANGSRVPLARAATNLALLTDYLSDPDSDWDIVYYLREVCLGRRIEPEQTKALIKEQLLLPDGSVDPAMEAVVLSAVRGEGRVLHIGSPFTDSLDRAMAEFVNARNFVRSQLDEPDAEAFLRDDPARHALDLLKPPKKWTERQSERTDPPSDPPGNPLP